MEADLYSFGILLYELWEPFDTVMERCKVLDSLREQGPCEAFKERQPVVADLVSSLLKVVPAERPSAEAIVTWIREESGPLGGPAVPESESCAFFSDKPKHTCTAEVVVSLEQKVIELQAQLKAKDELLREKDERIRELESAFRMGSS